jgi:hypothetical protein
MKHFNATPRPELHFTHSVYSGKPLENTVWEEIKRREGGLHQGTKTPLANTGHYSTARTHEAWKEGDPWPPVESDSEEEDGFKEEAVEDEEQASEEEEDEEEGR